METPWNAVRYDPKLRKGHVESYFLKLNDPEGRRALWLKATILASHARPVEAEVWAIAFDREEGHAAVKEVVPFEEAAFSKEGFDVKVAGVHFEEGHIVGSIARGDELIEWDLHFDATGAPMVPLAYDWMYTGPFPSSKFVTPHPHTRYTGHYTKNGQKVSVEGWRGMQGHNWGKQHAELYAWSHCNQWHDHDDLMVEAITARIKVGPVLVPPLTVLSIWNRGVRYQFTEVKDLLLARGSIGQRSLRFRAHNDLASAEGEFHTDTENMVGLYYENPNGDMTYCLNSKIAEGRVRLDVKGRPPVIATTRAAALEVATKDPKHGVRMYV